MDTFSPLLQQFLNVDESGLDMGDYVNKRVATDSLALNEQMHIEQT